MPIFGAIAVGAGVGAGVALATGGDPWKGAMYGAVGGGIGGWVAPSVAGVPTGFSAGAGVTAVGGAAGGAAGSVAGTYMTGMLTPPGLRMPAPTKLAPRPTISAEITKITARLGERLKKARSRIASRVMLPGQISELANIQRPMLSDILG